VLDQTARVEQVPRALSDRPAPPGAGRERRTRDVPDVVLLAEDAFVGQGAIGGVDVREGPPEAL